jgi:DNA-binding CsgD family transcriptional regulator
MVSPQLTSTDLAMDFSGSRAVWKAISSAVTALHAGFGGVVRVIAERGSGWTTLLDRTKALADQFGVDVLDSTTAPLSFLALVDAGTGSRPLLVCVDARRGRGAADEPALELAPKVVAGRPVLWVIGAEHFEHVGESVVTLDRLTAAEQTALAQSHVGQAIPANLGDALTRCLALPRAVVESVALWRGEPTLEPDELVWPDALLNRLDTSELGLLSIAARVADKIDPATWARTSGVALAQLIPAAVRAVQAGVLKDEGDRLAFVHPLVRRALLQRESSSDIRVTADMPDRMGQLGEARAIRRDLREMNPIDRQELRARAIVREVDAGVVRLEQLRAWIHLETPTVSIALLTTHLLFDEVLDSNVLARTLTEPLTPEQRRSVEAARAARSVLIHSDDLVEWNSIFTSVPEDRVPDVAILVHLARALGEAARGRLRSSLRHVSRATDLSASHAAGPNWWTARILRARLLADLGRGHEALRIVEDSLQVADKTGSLSALRAMLTLHGSLLLEYGRFAAADRSLRLSVDIGKAVGSANGLEGDPELLLARIAHVQGTQMSAPALGSTDEPEAMTANASASRTGAISRLANEPTLDPPTAARSLAEAMSGTNAQPAYPVVRSVTDELVRVRLFLRAGEEIQAREVWRNLRRLATNEPSPLLTAAAGHADGVLRSRAQPIGQAQLVYERLELPILRALAAEDRADAEGKDGLIAGLREARSIWASLGGTRETARIDKRLRGLGVRAVDSAAPILNLGLSSAEEKVALHVGAGLSNRLIAEALALSPNTVGAHLRRIYAKTGASDRPSLIAIVKRQQIATSEGISH